MCSRTDLCGGCRATGIPTATQVPNDSIPEEYMPMFRVYSSGSVTAGGKAKNAEIGSKTPDGLGRLEEVRGLLGRPAGCFDAIGNAHTAKISSRQE